MESTFRTHEKNFEMLQKLQSDASDTVFKDDWESMGMRPVVNPFWRHLPFSNIFQSFTSGSPTPASQGRVQGSSSQMVLSANFGAGVGRTIQKHDRPPWFAPF